MEKRYVLTRKDSNGEVVLSRSKNLSYVDRRMCDDWLRVLEKEPNRRRCYFIKEYASVEGVATWSITTE